MQNSCVRRTSLCLCCSNCVPIMTLRHSFTFVLFFNTHNLSHFPRNDDDATKTSTNPSKRILRILVYPKFGYTLHNFEHADLINIVSTPVLHRFIPCLSHTRFLLHKKKFEGGQKMQYI